MGFPGKSIDDLELVEDGGSDEDTTETDSQSENIDDEKTDEDDEVEENDESGSVDATNEGKYCLAHDTDSQSIILDHVVCISNMFVNI